MTQTPLSEAAMDALEEHIPELAVQALKRAYYFALTTDGKVLEAVDGQLVETYADGTRRVIRQLPKPFHVELGAKRTRLPRT